MLNKSPASELRICSAAVSTRSYHYLNVHLEFLRRDVVVESFLSSRSDKSRGRNDFLSGNSKACKLRVGLPNKEQEKNEGEEDNTVIIRIILP